MLKPFWLALQFLTRLPTPHYESVNSKEVGQSVAWYPLVGLLIGLLLVGVAQLHFWLPASIVSGLVLAVWVWLTGALHLDGLADSADGWLGANGDSKRALEIMKDSQIGAGGGVVLVVFMILKWTVLVELINNQAWLFLLIAPFWGRISALLLIPTTPYVSVNGIAEQMVKHLNVKWVWGWLCLFVVVLFWMNTSSLTVQSVLPVLSLVVGLMLVWVWLRWAMMKLTGGMTGDTAGAMTEVSELALMLLSIALLIN
ncbi:MAG: adenosylcobinamide-GDP ribazoletransferase [Gammaproteobacteria bacterium]|nr:adenosylcobinamide-GDP ribazoletransferase [Gammaproteobacteria bacterium]